MRKTIRFQIRSALPNFLAMAALTAVIVLLTALSGGRGFFVSYYMGLPMIFLIFALVDGSNLSMAQLHVALCMGADRRGYFWGAQVVTVLYAAVLTLFHLLAARLPGLLGLSWEINPLMQQAPWWLFAISCICLKLVGVAVGFVMRTNRKKGVLALLAAMVAAAGIFFALFVVSTGDCTWGNLPAISAAVIVAASAAMELAAWRGCRNAVVR